jgi:hypothetical protein
MERSEIPHDPRHLGVPSATCKMISEPLSYVKISTVSKQTELSLEPRHQRVPYGASKMISKPMVHDFWVYATFDAIVHLCCIKISAVSKWTKLSLESCHQEVPLGETKMILEPVVCSTQSVHLSCIQISTIPTWTELSLEPHHRGVPLGASKTISELTIRLAQTMHLSCVKISTTSERTKMSFHLSPVT